MRSQEPDRRTTDEENPRGAPSGRAAQISLVVGVALFLFLLAAPYLNDL